MANALITPDIITRQALTEFKNAMVLLAKVDRQLGAQLARKIGDTINVRRRVRYEAVDGPDITGLIQDTLEGSIPVTLEYYKTVPIQFDTTELTLTIEDFNERYIRPAMIELAQTVESIIADQYKKIYWFTGEVGTSPSTLLDIATAKAIQDDAGVPQSMRYAFYSPFDMVSLADGLSTVFPDSIARTAIEMAFVGRYAGYDLMDCQSIVRHSAGAQGGTPLVDGVDQDVEYSAVTNTYNQTLDTKGWSNSVTDVLLEGDVFTIAGVYAVNPRTRTSIGRLQTFVVREDADSDSGGDATLTISPPIIISGPFQTVDSVPADSAAITVLSGTAGEQSTQNLLWDRNAITVAFAKLVPPEGGAIWSRQEMDGVSVRYVSQFDILTDVNVKRFDILFAVEAQNPGMAIRHVGTN
ncbi:MAG: hypothetical protein GY799_16055 [Desulfobulbaceae bacterium]|nr:hypothetical protein [Desulfobulbaceae bacterium]